MKNFKWPVAVLAFVLTLALSVGAVVLRERQLINEPLFKHLSEFESVQTVELHRENNRQIVVVTLNYVEDLGLTHRELNEEIDRLLGHNRFRLEIIDGRNQALEAAFVAVHLSLYEGEHRGNFTEMGSRVDEILLKFGITEHKVFVDSEHIYLQMRDGDAYLYEIIPRGNQGRDGENV